MTTQELYLTLYTAALGGLGDSVGRTTTPITAAQAAAFAGDMATEGMEYLYNNKVITTYLVTTGSVGADEDPILPETPIPPSVFSPDVE